MTSQVYYRKWRPQQLSDLVGQEAVVRTLKQALVQKRVAHAYLFCGPRGTGKTSTARILAKAVSCLSPLEDGEPDNACHLCQAIAEGRSLDLIEIDAASNRGIDEIRSLRDKARFAPSESAYKIYVLDEAHMLTDAASDALLKTLEEPPPHVIFILATTEPHRLSSTITSRCQRFDFRRISPAATVERLSQICQGEGITIEPEALRAITRSASGSLRDAENLLEQAVTSFGNSLGLEQVRLLLGLSADDRARILAGHLLRAETAPALALINAIAAEGLDLRQFHRQLVEEFRELLLLKSGAREMVEQPVDVLQQQETLLSSVSLELLLRILRLLGQVTFRYDTPDTLPLELAAVECALDQSPTESVASTPVTPSSAPSPEPPRTVAPTDSAPAEEPEAAPSPPTEPPPEPVAVPSTPAYTGPQPSAQPRPDPTPVATPSAPAYTGPRPSTQPRPDPTPVASETPAGSPSSPGQRNEPWDEMVRALSRYKGKRFNLGALLRACRQHRLEGATLTLSFTHRSHMERMQEEMDFPESRRTFLDAAARALGATTPLELAFTAANGQAEAAPPEESPLVKAALGMGAKILDQGSDTDQPQSNQEREYE